MLTLYVFEDVEGCADTFTTMDLREAKERAAKYGMRLIAQEYEFSDSELIIDHTPTADPARHCFREDSTSEECSSCGYPAEAHSGCDCDVVEA